MDVLRSWWSLVLLSVLLPGQDERQALLRGRVLDGDGAPLAGAAVFAMDNGSGGIGGPTPDPLAAYLQTRLGDRSARQRLWATVRTDADGAFSMLVPADSCDLFFQHERHADAERLDVDVAKAVRDGVGDIGLREGGKITGLVTDAAGAPLAEATVRLMSVTPPGLLQATPGREKGLVATTDRAGRFRFAHVPEDHRVTVIVGCGGYASQSAEAKTTALAAAPQIFALRAQSPTAGIVVDARGRPMRGVSLLAKDERPANRAALRVLTGADGSFELLDLVGNEAGLTIQAEGYFTTKVRLPVGSCGHRVELVPLPELRLRVLGADGARVDAFALTLARGNTVLPGYRERSIGGNAVVAEGDGAWAVLPPVPEGRLSVLVDDGVHARAVVELPPIEPGVQPKVTVRLTRGAVLVGQVAGPDGKPLVGARVSSAADEPEPPHVESGEDPVVVAVPSLQPRTAVTGADGSFALSALEPGTHLLRVRHAEFCNAEVRGLVVAAGGRADAGRIALAAGALVAGRFANGKGLPPRRLELVAATAGERGDKVQQRWRAVSDGDGNFRLFDRVPAGRYVLSHWPRTLGFPLRNNAVEVAVEIGAALTPVFVELPVALPPGPR